MQACVDSVYRRVTRFVDVSDVETFSSTLTSEEENSGAGGIAMLTLSDTENNLHFILILQGLIKHRDKGERKSSESGETSAELGTFGISF